MKAYIFKSENNDFTDILSDGEIQRHFKTQLFWAEHMLLVSENLNKDNEVHSYIMLKYGHTIVTDSVIRDFSPVPYVDYQPNPNRPKKFKDVYK